MQLIRTMQGYSALLTNAQERPSQEWLALQATRPRAKGRWFKAYPLNGGAMLVQEGTYTIERDATQADIDQATTRSFNPAANEIKALWQAQGERA